MPRPLPRSQVRLLDGPLLRRQQLNSQYLLGLDPDRLLHSFRTQAGLASVATPYGGWEHSECGLRGHFVGHYLSACAHAAVCSDDPRFGERVSVLVAGLAECQRAGGTGYLSAFPASAFDTLEREFGGAWAPYYTLHKILAGLVDAHREAGVMAALPVAAGLGDWIARRMAAVAPERVEPLLRTAEANPLNEYGGIGEALYDLYALTGDARHLTAAQTFDRDWFLGPLMEGRDELTGLHSNTHIPQLLAAARRYELTGEGRYRRAAEYFWQRTALARSFANGGSSGPRPGGGEKSPGAEHWPPAHRQGEFVSPKINESCVVLNMLRLTDRLFAWEPRAEYAEFRERAFTNSVLAMQHPGHPGGYLYHHPLTPGSRKEYGKPEESFWCCYGTSVEAFATLVDGAYHADDEAIWVTQFVASRAVWGARGVTITQRTDFPKSGEVTITIGTRTPVEFALVVRIPGWAEGATWKIEGTGELCPGRVDGGFVTIRRRWTDGDVVSLVLPMTIRSEELPGGEARVALFRGPQLLAAGTDGELRLEAPEEAACACVRCEGGETHVSLSGGAEVKLVPIAEIVEEPFGAYFAVTPTGSGG